MTFFDGLLLGADNFLHGALCAATLSTTYSFASKRGSISPDGNSVSAELKEERKTTATLRQQFETAWGGNHDTQQFHFFSLRSLCPVPIFSVTTVTQSIGTP